MSVLFKASDYLKKRLVLCQSGQSTLEYAMVMVIAGIISAILISVGKPYIVDIISKAFEKISNVI